MSHQYLIDKVQNIYSAMSRGVSLLDVKSLSMKSLLLSEERFSSSAALLDMDLETRWLALSGWGGVGIAVLLTLLSRLCNSSTSASFCINASQICNAIHVTYKLSYQFINTSFDEGGYGTSVT